MGKAILHPNKVSFAVAEVEPGQERLPEITVRTALERTIRTKLLTCSNPAKQSLRVEIFIP